MRDILGNVTASPEDLKKALALIRDRFINDPQLSAVGQVMEGALRRIRELESYAGEMGDIVSIAEERVERAANIIAQHRGHGSVSKPHRDLARMVLTAALSGAGEADEETVERAARSMCESDGFDWDAKDFRYTSNGEEPEEQREYWREKARVALRAIKT